MEPLDDLAHGSGGLIDQSGIGVLVEHHPGHASQQRERERVQLRAQFESSACEYLIEAALERMLQSALSNRDGIAPAEAPSSCGRAASPRTKLPSLAGV